MIRSLLTTASFRFPKPDFSTGYELPSTQLPDPKQFNIFPEIYTPIVLCIILALTLWIFRKTRSRTQQLLLCIAVVIIFGFIKKGCLCSIGSIQTVSLAAALETAPITLSQILIFLIPLITALFFGRIFCGAACPLGALQDILNFKNIRLPRTLHETLLVIPFIYLGFAVLYAALDLEFIICSHDPYVGIFRGTLGTTAITATVIMLLVGMIITRPYCKYICPYGALLKLCSAISIKPPSIPVDDDCINCDFCKDICPMDAIIPPNIKLEKHNVSINRLKICLALSPGIAALGVIFGLHMTQVLEYNYPEISSPAIPCLILGIYLAMVIIIKLISICRIRTNETYIIDKTNCIACSRCFSICPKNQKRS